MHIPTGRVSNLNDWAQREEMSRSRDYGRLDSTCFTWMHFIKKFMETLCKPNTTSAGTTSSVTAPGRLRHCGRNHPKPQELGVLKVWDLDIGLLYAFVLLRKATTEKLASINTTVTISQKETKIVITGRWEAHTVRITNHLLHERTTGKLALLLLFLSSD